MTVEYLILRLESAATSARWAAFDADGRLLSPPAGGALADAAEAARGRRLVVLVPGVEVVATEAVLPSASPARQRKMLPYSLEDALAEDIDNVFFAVGARRPSGTVPVAVVSRERLEAWLAALAGAGLEPQAVYSDADGVPDTPATLTLVIEGDRVYGREPDGRPFVFEGLPLDGIVDALTAGGRAPGYTHAVVYLDEGAEARHAAELRRLPQRIESTDVKLLADGAWCRLAATLVVSPGLNLLQGVYGPKSNWAEVLRPWRFAAALLLAVVLIGMLGRGAEYLSLRRQDQALTTRLTADCARAVGARQLRACEAEVSRRLGGSARSASAGRRSFFEALAAVAASQAPQSRIEALSYRNDVMDLQLVVPDVSALNAFVQDVQRSKQFEVHIQSTNPGKDGVEGRVQVVGANP